ncbi:hypothetical protein WJX73_000416 [Symbiochloris irregularis]|uniref:Uncharacterized protein n=1 Tax=Symbiochloris irregularis TaxID=706552 RepID=A0AAW1PR21_9CHLO
MTHLGTLEFDQLGAHSSGGLLISGFGTTACSKVRSAGNLGPRKPPGKVHSRSGLQPLRVSHDRFSHDLVAMSAANSQPGLSRSNAGGQLQRLGGGTPNPLERLLIVAHYREDLAWLDDVSYLPSIIYQADNETASNRVIRNMGETAAYLQYIVEHYDVLPKHMAFVHGHRKAKHMPDIVPVLQNLQWGRHGYANLRYVNITFKQWGAWTGDWLHPSWPEQAPPRPEIVWDDLRISMSRNYAQMWSLLFEKELGQMPEYVHAPCCAEFVVSAERVRKHSKQFYASLLDWLRHTSNDRFWAGRIFEYVWHIVFGEEPIYTAPQKFMQHGSDHSLQKGADSCVCLKSRATVFIAGAAALLLVPTTAAAAQLETNREYGSPTTTVQQGDLEALHFHARLHAQQPPLPSDNDAEIVFPSTPGLDKEIQRLDKALDKIDREKLKATDREEFKRRFQYFGVDTPMPPPRVLKKPTPKKAPKEKKEAGAATVIPAPEQRDGEGQLTEPQESSTADPPIMEAGAGPGPAAGPSGLQAEGSVPTEDAASKAPESNALPAGGQGQAISPTPGPSTSAPSQSQPFPPDASAPPSTSESTASQQLKSELLGSSVPLMPDGTPDGSPATVVVTRLVSVPAVDDQVTLHLTGHVARHAARLLSSPAQLIVSSSSSNFLAGAVESLPKLANEIITGGSSSSSESNANSSDSNGSDSKGPAEAAAKAQEAASEELRRITETAKPDAAATDSLQDAAKAAKQLPDGAGEDPTTLLLDLTSIARQWI